MIPLSPREREVMTLAACGFTDNEVARRLGIGVKSVKTYKRIAFNKLDARNTVHAVARLLCAGVISADDVMLLESE